MFIRLTSQAKALGVNLRNLQSNDPDRCDELMKPLQTNATSFISSSLLKPHKS